MKIKVNTVLKNLAGTPLLDRNEKGEAVEATIKMALVNATISDVKGDSGIKKMEKWTLGKRIFDAVDDVELSAEEITLIKERVGELYQPMIVGQVFEILEGKKE